MRQSIRYLMVVFLYVGSFFILQIHDSYAFFAGSNPENISQRCGRYFSIYEKKFNMPDRILRAISTTESGRWFDEKGRKLPWPWTIHALGRGYYFENKQQAIRKVRNIMRKGVNSIDVGCMQINLLHHASAFSTIYQAFEPRHNIHYAATFLYQNYRATKNWKKAISHYHSKDPANGAKYLARVMDSWVSVNQLFLINNFQSPLPVKRIDKDYIK